MVEREMRSDSGKHDQDQDRDHGKDENDCTDKLSGEIAGQLAPDPAVHQVPTEPWCLSAGGSPSEAGCSCTRTAWMTMRCTAENRGLQDVRVRTANVGV